VTVLHFGASQRRETTAAERCAELATWWGRMLDHPALAAELTLASLTRALTRLENVQARNKQLGRRRD
jgi:hypothetical protein